MHRLLTIFISAFSFQLSAFAEQPNIVFFLADDLAYHDISHFGQKHYSTPNIDKLATEGRVFSNAYAGGPWCSPSRTALLLGRRTGHHGPLERDASGKATKFQPTLAEMLKPAGYTSGIVGKWHMGETEKDSWAAEKTWEQQKANTNWAGMPWNRGFDFARIGYRGRFQGANGNPYFPLQVETGDNQEIKFPNNQNFTADWIYKRNAKQYDAQGRYLDPTGKNSDQLTYCEDFYRAEAIKFMRQSHQAKKPFFLLYATPLIHKPIQAKALGKFNDKDGKEWTLERKIHAAMVEELDRSLGALLDELDKLGIADNTLVVFTSDNGYVNLTGKGTYWHEDTFFNNKGPWNRGKHITTNGGVYVPFIARWPGHTPKGETTRALTFYDFVPTVRDVTGITLPGPTDGVSFLPLLEGRDDDQALRDHLIWTKAGVRYSQGIPDDWATATDPKPNKKNDIPNAALIDEKFFAIHVHGRTRLFDMFADPGMKTNIADQHPAIKQRAEDLFKKLAK